ncbi:MAG TPA: translocation/assembly module TamB domain-containing protein [Vicinamibacterales bacterium]|nr:translocation/assembly module TamB domain-containing protein [Vicinamibacterales bacterium]HPW19903.1 translocation/assembly module TamB domain-containing protein [Vicinamibacterales bacterium]
MGLLHAIRRAGPYARRAGMIALGVAAAGVVLTLSVDLAELAPALTGGRVDLRQVASSAASAEFDRPVRVGGLSVRLVDGRFLIRDLVIEGLSPAATPFLTAREVAVDMPLWSLVRRRLAIRSIEVSDWALTIETWTGRDNLPALRSRGRTGPSSITTTLAFLHGRRGVVHYADHASPITVIARDFEITATRSSGYRGQTTSTGGTIAIQSYTPMSADIRTWFRIDGGKVHFDRIELDTDGASTVATGDVDVPHWPEMTYQIESRIQLAPQRGIWWANDRFTLSGEATFKGRLHYFKGGRELAGEVASDEFGINWIRFPDATASVVWTAARLDVSRARSRFYGGRMDLTYAMAPLNVPGTRSTARLDVRYSDVDLGAFSDAMAMKGLRLAGRATGRNDLEWRLGAWEGHRGGGEIQVSPPPGVRLQGKELGATRRPPSFAHVYGDPFPPLGRVPIGGRLRYTYGAEWVDVEPGDVASPWTYLALEGRTAWGERSRIPFHVTSTDWQQSMRELAGVLTAFGSPSRPAEVGGEGTFEGVLFNAIWDPRIEGFFAGAGLTFWDVDWGRGESAVVIEHLYADVKDAEVRKGAGTLRATGRFSLGYPRRDRGEELNAVIRISDWDLADFRHAFEFDAYPWDGRVHGELHLWGAYEEPFGFGKVTLAPLAVYEETLTSATASLRFDGPGVWLDGIEMRKGATGIVRGGARAEWLGSYSFNVDGQNIPVESVDLFAFPDAPLSGRLDFTASGGGKALDVSYDADFRMRDLYVKDEGIGDVKGRLELRGDDMNVSFDAISSRLTASGAGKVTLLGDYPGDVTLRLTDASLDPYARVFMPGLSPFASAVGSGTVRVSGTLLSLDNVVAHVHVERLALKLFDYVLQNDGGLDASLEQGILRVGRFRLSGEDTRLTLSGNVDLVQGILGMRAEGSANLGILQAVTSNVRGSGRADVTADFTGTLEEPRVGGSAAIEGGRLRHMWLPHAIDGINGRVRFDGESVRFDDIAATIGRGDVRLGGRVDLAGLWPSRFDITATGEGMELRYPEGFRSVIDADLGLRGTVDDLVLGGTVLVRRGELRRDLELGTGLADLAAGGGGAGIAAPQAPAPALPLRFDLRLSAPSTIEIDNKLARLTASADLRLRGTYARPVLEGRAEVQRGELWFEGKRYVVSRGSAEFTNPSKIDPYFDVEAETRVRAPGQTYRVTFRVAGTTSAFEYDLSSDPPLPEVDVLSLLLGDVGSTQDAELRALRTPDEAEQNLLIARSARLLASPISSGVQKAVEQTFGLDSVQIAPFFVDPSQSAGRFSPGARLTIGKRISDRIYLTYSRSLSSAARDQVILLEYDQSDRLAWIVTQNEDRTYALDLRVRHVFR